VEQLLQQQVSHDYYRFNYSSFGNPNLFLTCILLSELNTHIATVAAAAATSTLTTALMVTVSLLGSN
jgi:hypothetical protein